MIAFKLQEGGKTENPKQVLVILNRDIDKDLIISAVNKKAGEKVSVEGIAAYIDEQFKALDSLIDFDTLETFYY